MSQELLHYGVKGMRWGVRKKYEPAPASISTEGVTIKRDGTITIQPGAQLQRLTSSKGKSMPLKDMTYLSINEFDNAKYMKLLGPGLMGGGRDQVMSIKAVKPIKTPSKIEATKIHSELMLKDKAYQKQVTNLFGASIKQSDLDAIRKDPTGEVAQMWYLSSSMKVGFAPSAEQAFLRDSMAKAYLSKGYNAIRDENDANSGASVAPVIVFAPEKNLEVVKISTLTKEMQKANKEKLKQYKAHGRDWVEQQLYSD